MPPPGSLPDCTRDGDLLSQTSGLARVPIQEDLRADSAAIANIGRQPAGEMAPGGLGVASAEWGEHLADNKHISVVLRLVVDEQRVLVHGEVVDVDGHG